MYRPIGKSAGIKTKQNLALIADGGIDNKNLEQMLNPANSLICDNFDIEATGILKSVKGHVEKFTVSGGGQITMLKKFLDDMWIFAYDKIVAKYVPSTDTVTTINTFTTTHKFDGVAAGDYFLCCNGDTRIGVINLAGTTFTENADTNTPKADTLWVQGGRLFSNDINTEGVYWSDVYTGTGTPYQDYTPVATPPLMAESWLTFKQGAGKCTGFGSLDNDIIFAIFEKARVKFKLDAQTNDTDIRQNIITAFETFTSGGGSKAITTTKGVVYATSEGIFLAPAGEIANKVDINISSSLGGVNLKDYNFDDSDFVEFDDKLWVTIRDNADNNNLIAKYDWDKKGWSFRTSMQISRFMPIDNALYGGSSVESVVYQLESGYNDLDEDIRSEYLQPLNTPIDWTRIETLIRFFIQGKLSASSSIEVSFDRIGQNGNVTEKVASYTWTRQGASTGIKGIGKAGIGKTGIGGKGLGAKTLLSRADASPYIKNSAGLRLRIVSIGQVPFEIHSFKTEMEFNREQRNNNLT